MAGIDDLEMARSFLERLGVSPTDLTRSEKRKSVPTFGEFVPIVAGVVPMGSRKVYTPYWLKLTAQWGDARIDEKKPTDINWFIEHAKRTAIVRRSSRGGHSAAEHAFHALRCVHKYAVWNRLIDAREDPTEQVARPKRLKSNRHALDNALVSEIIEVASTTGNDPALDALLIRLHLETAARRGGALRLRLRDLDREQCLVRLHEKGDVSRWQPVSPTLMKHLLLMAHNRGARDEDSPVLRSRAGTPLTKRRYDHLWRRLGEHIDSVRTLGVSTHWLRHTTLTWVERSFGYAVARAYAGHSAATANRFSVTATYVRATINEVAEALSALTGEPHPLAPPAEVEGEAKPPAAD
ncbi:tyrosine-type recombinase/integrase [Saccharothrix isguenensis]